MNFSISRNPVPKNAIKLKALENVYRIKVGKYRVLYKIFFERKLIVIARIGKRESVYEKI